LLYIHHYVPDLRTVWTFSLFFILYYWIRNIQIKKNEPFDDCFLFRSKAIKVAVEAGIDICMVKGF
jgi:hypothetical protein